MLFYKRIYLLIFFLVAAVLVSSAQIADTAVARKIYESKDSLSPRPKEENLTFKETDITKLKDPKARSPKKAAIRSAILPGWGQVYNNKIWKVPIVYGALGGTGYYFFFSLKWYNQFKLATKVAMGIAASNDSTGYDKITDPQIRNYVNSNYTASLKNIRDSYRKDVDYSAVYFMIAWLLNIVDATVDAHLSTFDVNPNLTFKIQTGYSELARTNGVSLVLKFK